MVESIVRPEVIRTEGAEFQSRFPYQGLAASLPHPEIADLLAGVRDAVDASLGRKDPL